jgi:iron(III) transport system permease protein
VVIWLALADSHGVWSHLISTTLTSHLSNSLLLGAGTALLAGMIGTGAAWLVVTYRFPFSRLLEWALLAPLAVPGWIAAFAFVDLFDYSGPVQGGLRWMMGWTRPDDYMFPEIRSLPFAVLVLSLSLYPYVYLITRASFLEQSARTGEVARTLGTSSFRRFFALGLPMARPAIAIGVAVVAMEVMNDLGTSQAFAVPTLTTGIFSLWLDGRNLAGAAQLACLTLGIIMLLVMSEALNRRRLRFWQNGKAARPQVPMAVSRGAGALMTLACLVPVALGFVMPVLVMVNLAMGDFGLWLDRDLGRAVLHSVITGFAAACLATAAAVLVVLAARRPKSKVGGLLPLVTAGYGIPGAVLALGLLIPVSAFDNQLADLVAAVTGVEIGLILSGSAGLIILAYSIRFIAIPVGSLDGSFGGISPSLSAAARSLGAGPARVFRDVQLPLMRRTLATALLLVFVDCVKELPATLFLRPFNYDTLATRVFEKVSLEDYQSAAPAALLVMLLGLVAVFVLIRTAQGERR